MRKNLVPLIVSLAVSLPMFADPIMCVEQNIGETVEFDVANVRKVYMKNVNDTTSIDTTEVTDLLLTIPDFLDSTAIATSKTDISSLLATAKTEINKIDPKHKFLRVAVISDLHSVPNDDESQKISLYKGTSCTDNIVLFGNAIEKLDCDAGFALGDYCDNRIAYSNVNTEIKGGIAKYQEEAKSVINKLRNSHTKPMFFTMGNHEFGDALKGQIYDSDTCNMIIQTSNRPGDCSVAYMNGNAYSYSVSFTDYKVKIALNSDGKGINNGWDIAADIYENTPQSWTVGCFTHGSYPDPLNGRHDGSFTKHYTFSERNIKCFGIVRGHVHDSGNVGFDYVTESTKGHYLKCPRLSLPASYYADDQISDTDHFCVTIIIFDTTNNKTRVVRLGRANWEKYVESKEPTFPYSYDFVSGDK